MKYMEFKQLKYPDVKQLYIFDALTNSVEHVLGHPDYPNFREPTSIQMDRLAQLMDNMYYKSEDAFDFGQRGDRLVELLAQTSLQNMENATTWELLEATQW